MSNFKLMLETDKIRIIKTIQGLQYLKSLAESDEFFYELNEEGIDSIAKALQIAETHLVYLNDSITDLTSEDEEA